MCVCVCVCIIQMSVLISVAYKGLEVLRQIKYLEDVYNFPNVPRIEVRIASAESALLASFLSIYSGAHTNMHMCVCACVRVCYFDSMSAESEHESFHPSSVIFQGEGTSVLLSTKFIPQHWSTLVLENNPTWSKVPETF